MTQHSFRCPACGTTVVLTPDGPRHSDPHLKFASTLLAAGNWPEAIDQLSKALEIDPSSRLAWFLRALATALVGVEQGEAYLDPYLEEASIYLATAAPTPEEAGAWLGQTLPHGPSRLADTLIELVPAEPWQTISPNRAVWGNFVVPIADQLAAVAQRGGWRTQVLAVYLARQGRHDEAEAILDHAANQGDTDIAALGLLDLAQLCGGDDPRTTVFIDRALKLAGDQQEDILGRAGISHNALINLGWSPPSPAPPQAPPTRKRWWQS